MLLSSVVSDGAGEWFQLLLATVRFGTRRSRRRNPWHSRANPWHCRFVLCAGGGQPLVEPDGLVSVGAPRGEQRDGQIDVGGAGGAQVREARAGELGAAPAGGGIPERRRPECGEAVQHCGEFLSSWPALACADDWFHGVRRPG